MNFYQWKIHWFTCNSIYNFSLFSYVSSYVMVLLNKKKMIWLLFIRKQSKTLKINENVVRKLTCLIASLQCLVCHYSPTRSRYPWRAWVAANYVSSKTENQWAPYKMERRFISMPKLKINPKGGASSLVQNVTVN